MRMMCEEVMAVKKSAADAQIKICASAAKY